MSKRKPSTASIESFFKHSRTEVSEPSSPTPAPELPICVSTHEQVKVMVSSPSL